MEHEEERGKGEILVLAIRCIVSFGLAMLGQFYLNEANFPWWANLLVMGVAYLIVAYDIIAKTFIGIFKERDFFNECTLMLLASLGAFALRLYGPEHNEFLEGILVILLFQVGELFEDLAADKSREAITSALDLRKEKAKVIVDGAVVERAPKDLHIGDLVLLGVGMKCPCDGTIAEGKGALDESSLTGEAIPVEKKEGDPVYAGTILREGSLQIRVDKDYEDSTVAKLLELVEHAAEKKSKTTRFITYFARYYTPIVFLLAALVAVIPPLCLGMNDGATWSRFIYAALSFLVVSCPCAIVISVPLAYFAGLGLASRHGVLVKGAEYFDKVNALKVVAFDKTGTLTKGQFAVAEIHPVGLTEEGLLEYACAAETASTHPLAEAVKKAYPKPIDLNDVRDPEEIPGLGVKVRYSGHEVAAGKFALMREGSAIEAPADLVGSVIYVSVDGEYRGYLVLRDEIKESVRPLSTALREKGIKTLLLSGDKQSVVDYVGKTLEIDQYLGDLLPEGKLKCLENEIKNAQGAVAFVGDGINDAPSLTLADIGIAMGGLGSDAAVSSADVVIMDDDPRRILSLLSVAKKTKRRAIFNIACSLTVKGLIMALALLATFMGTWELPLFVAVLGDSGLAMLMILSSLLLGAQKPISLDK